MQRSSWPKSVVRFLINAIILAGAAGWVAIFIAAAVLAFLRPDHPLGRVEMSFPDPDTTRYISLRRGVFSIGQIDGFGEVDRRWSMPYCFMSAMTVKRTATEAGKPYVLQLGDACGYARASLFAPEPEPVQRFVSAQWWALLIVGVPWLLVAGRIAYRPMRRWRRRRRGLCVACGYDLTGNTSGACSECGATWRKARSPDGQGTLY
jgi:hypothetical protein